MALNQFMPTQKSLLADSDYIASQKKFAYRTAGVGLEDVRSALSGYQAPQAEAWQHAGHRLTAPEGHELRGLNLSLEQAKYLARQAGASEENLAHAWRSLTARHAGNPYITDPQRAAVIDFTRRALGFWGSRYAQHQQQQAAQQAAQQQGAVGGVAGGGMPLTGDYGTILQQSQQAAAPQMQAIDQAVQQAGDLTQEYTEREEALAPLVEGLGQADEQLLQQQQKQALAQWKQGAINRGIFGTTAYDRGVRSIQEAGAQDLAGLRSRLRQEAANYLGGLSSQSQQARQRYASFLQQAAGTGFGIGQSPISTYQQWAALQAAGQASQAQYQLGLAGLSQDQSLRMAQIQEQRRANEAARQTALWQMGQQQDLQRKQALQQSQQQMAMSRASAEARKGRRYYTPEYAWARGTLGHRVPIN